MKITRILNGTYLTILILTNLLALFNITKGPSAVLLAAIALLLITIDFFWMKRKDYIVKNGNYSNNACELIKDSIFCIITMVLIFLVTGGINSLVNLNLSSLLLIFSFISFLVLTLYLYNISIAKFKLKINYGQIKDIRASKKTFKADSWSWVASNLTFLGIIIIGASNIQSESLTDAEVFFAMLRTFYYFVFPNLAIIITYVSYIYKLEKDLYKA